MEPETKNQSPHHTSVFFWGFLIRDNKHFVPQLIHQLNQQNIVKVASGGFFFLALNSQGKLWGWGSTKYSRFGISNPENIMVPRPLGLSTKITNISAGNWHSIVLSEQGSLYGTGHNKYGCLGLGHFNNVQTFSKVPLNFQTKQVSAGDGFSIIISEDGQLYGAGHHAYHGHSSKQNLHKFKKICEDIKFKGLSCGFTHSLAISETGSIYSWGQGSFYQLGHGNKNDVKTPKIISELQNISVIHASCTRGEKYSHSMVVSEDGRVYTWGAGYKGKLGHHEEWSHADPADEPRPRLLKSIDYKVTKVLAGGIHSGVLDDNGNLYTFGCGSDGRIGHPESSDHRYLYREGTPRKIESLADMHIIDASFSYYQNICVGYKK